MSWLYQTCYNNLVTSLVVSTRLLGAVNTLLQICSRFETSSTSTFWQTCYKMLDSFKIHNIIFHNNAINLFTVILTANLLDHISYVTSCTSGGFSGGCTLLLPLVNLDWAALAQPIVVLYNNQNKYPEFCWRWLQI